MAARLWKLYLSAAKSRPGLTQIVSSGVLWACGDLVAQNIAGEGIDGTRVAQMSFYGLALYGPALTKWFRLQERWFPGNTVRIAATKVTVHTLVMAPLTVAGTILYAGVTQKRPKEEIVERLKVRTVPVWLAGAFFWVPFNFVNYRFIPVEVCHHDHDVLGPCV